ncbi:isochorismate synthase [Actinosynnema sp. NPDC047251]|uniref:isochorismate synthase n=1 Tax=Saccharothrix espanaensis (strain ATCC 51144 / DSM 44229 / JCM 9112 / NBRC 15066 / NRRL 15764) TaxID=1179773 RepID=K0K4R7_SACES|nr:isochorismate synthase [Saccharothrix espanaensis]CCH35265.1 Isochorismatase hydrolase [Saccharothrix espanaensis DSM 44229]
MTSAPVSRTRHRLRVRTERATDAGLLGRLPAPTGALAWVRDGSGLVGWGEAARFEVSGPDRFAAADRWWREFTATLEVEDGLGVPGSGPVAFVSLAFADRPGRSVLVVPEVVAGVRNGQAWLTTVGDGRSTEVRPVRRPRTVRYSDGELSVPAYREAVRAAVARMRAGGPAKVVLAHDLLAVADEPIDHRFVLEGLARRYPECWVYAVDGLIGATPELLLRRSGRVVDSRVLAGTTWPHDGVPDDDLAAALLSSAKDREEHEYAVASLTGALRPFCASLSVEGPSVLRLPNVSHLSSDVIGTLTGTPSLLALGAALHPTAAVGGTPRADALAVIEELEGMDRGRYAGPVGWIDANGDGELGVALRCAQVEGATARLFAGCGLVAESDPDSEVREAHAKLRPFREALEGM